MDLKRKLFSAVTTFVMAFTAVTACVPPIYAEADTSDAVIYDSTDRPESKEENVRRGVCGDNNRYSCDNHNY